MLNHSYLTQLAVKLQTTEVNVRREYVQHLLLSYLYQQAVAADLFFKGGTALRFLYQSPRFSEDLDFDASVHRRAVWEKAVETVLIALAAEGVRTDIRESKLTAGGYLAIPVFNLGGSEVLIKLEISFRKKEKLSGEIFSVANNFVPAYPLKALGSDQLAAGKLHALLDRAKARDFYDLYFLLRSNLLAAAQKKQLPEILRRLRAGNLDFNRELKLFLPKSQWLIIKDFRKTLEREIGRN